MSPFIILGSSWQSGLYYIIGLTTYTFITILVLSIMARKEIHSLHVVILRKYIPSPDRVSVVGEKTIYKLYCDELYVV